MAILKGNYNSSNNTYIQVDDAAKQWSLLKATPEQYQTTSGNLQFTEKGIETLKINAGFSNITGLANFSDAKNQDLFGPNPLEGIKNQRNEALALYGNSLTAAERENQIINQPDTALSALLGSNTSETLEQDSNFSVEQPPSSFSLPNASSGYTQGTARAVGSTNTSNILKYPIDMDLQIQDHLAITSAKYRPGGLPGIGIGTFGGSTQTSQFLRTRNEELGKTILLPMPNEIADQNSVSWGSGEFGGIAGSLFGPTASRLLDQTTALRTDEQKQKSENFIDKLKNFAGETGQYFTDLTNQATKIADQQFIRRRFLLGAAAKAASFVDVNVDVGAVVQRVGGVVENPNLELLFNGPGLRTFSFQIRFTPRNKSESIIVRKIIREFKQTMAVRRGQVEGYTNAGGSNLLLGTPDVYRIQYRRGTVNQEEIKGLNKFKTCALTDFSVNYTQGRWAAYAADSQPVSTLITMSFAELAPIYRDDYDDFKEDDDVGF
ncbi:baseplate tail tube cap [Synechococcus phage S-8S53]|nr:baseplate tail tube cap [Synechococcus phage S-8S53]